VRFAVAVGADEREAAAAAGEALDVEGTAADRRIRSGGAAGESDVGGEEARGKSDAFDGMEAVGELGGELLGEARGKDFDVDRKRVGRRSERGRKTWQRRIEIGVPEGIGGGGAPTEVPRSAVPKPEADPLGIPVRKAVLPELITGDGKLPDATGGAIGFGKIAGDVVGKDFRFGFRAVHDPSSDRFSKSHGIL
jgi:hypothetical protein